MNTSREERCTQLPVSSAHSLDEGEHLHNHPRIVACYYKQQTAVVLSVVLRHFMMTSDELITSMNR